jgi:hypothetical protein
MSALRKHRSRADIASPLALLALLLVAVLALAACGSDESAPGTPSSATNPSPAVSNERSASPSPSAASPSPAAVNAKHEPAPRGMQYALAETGIGTFGWKFSPTVDIKITNLGCYDADGDGLARSHRVGIFDAGSGRLLASATVRPKSTLAGFFRWEPLKTPLVLKAGQSYLAGTEDKDTVETLYLQTGESDLEWASEVGFDVLCHSRPSESAFTAPTVPQAPQRYPFVLSPNFMFMPFSPTP